MVIMIIMVTMLATIMMMMLIVIMMMRIMIMMMMILMMMIVIMTMVMMMMMWMMIMMMIIMVMMILMMMIVMIYNKLGVKLLCEKEKNLPFVEAKNLQIVGHIFQILPTIGINIVFLMIFSQNHDNLLRLHNQMRISEPMCTAEDYSTLIVACLGLVDHREQHQNISNLIDAYLKIGSTRCKQNHIIYSTFCMYNPIYPAIYNVSQQQHYQNYIGITLTSH